MDVLKKICAALDHAGVVYEVEEHAPTYTSQQAAEIRGTSMHQGAKALVVQGKKTGKHWLCVMPADLRLDTKKVRDLVGERVSFAKDPEVVTGCVPGSVPPFGSLLGLQTYVDKRLAENEEIEFNAGSLTHSIGIPYEAYIRVEQPEIVDITQEV